MEWSNEDCLQLIDLYEEHPVLWDAKHSFHFSKNKKIDAWDEIADKLNRDVNNVKQKMTSLLGSFRAQKSKGKKTIGTGKGRQEIYVSKWFAFERMQFLLDKDEPKGTFDTENEQFNENTFSPVEIPHDSTEAPLESQETEEAVTSRDVELSVSKQIEPPSKRPKKFKEKEDPRIKDAFRMLKETHEKYTLSQNEPADRFAIYGQHVAAKLKTYTKNTRAIVEHSINNILFDADMGKFDTKSTISTPTASPNIYNLPHQDPATIYNYGQTDLNISAATPSTSTQPGSSSRSTEPDEFDNGYFLQQLP